MYGTWSASCAHSRSSQASLTEGPAGASVMMGLTAPSAASTGSRRATCLISLTASFTRWTAGCELQPKAWRLKRALSSHL